MVCTVPTSISHDGTELSEWPFIIYICTSFLANQPTSPPPNVQTYPPSILIPSKKNSFPNPPTNSLTHSVPQTFQCVSRCNPPREWTNKTGVIHHEVSCPKNHRKDGGVSDVSGIWGICKTTWDPQVNRILLAFVKLLQIVENEDLTKGPFLGS